MASENKRRHKQTTSITFTLPLSCQICLGKVKQPVLCPNHHVFCQLCMDIWLEKNKQCPTCRVDINDNNPVKNIIGGQLEDEDVRKQSCAELRRARFELLYKEYEDQFDKMRKESIILRTENNILLAQLQEAEEKSDGQNESEKEVKGSSLGKHEPNLLVLTKNLQEAQTLYVGIKDEMTQLKQENSKLKDENVNLTRENENLRLEIAQRSPKKFGRYTVATLETKLSEYEKEIRQLKKALERSDEYVEDLEKQIEKLSDLRHRQLEQQSHRTKSNSFPAELPHSEKNGHIHSTGKGQLASSLGQNGDIKLLRSASSEDEASSSQDRESARRMLFSLCAENGDVPSQRSQVGHSKSAVNLENGNGEDAEHAKYPESIMKHGGGGDNSHKQYNGNTSDMNGKTPKTKKVQFNVPKPANSSASFELEMPSPYGNNKQISANQSDSNNASVEVNDKGDEVDGFPPATDFDSHVVSLLKKANASNFNSHIPGIKVANSEDLISKHEASGHNLTSKKTSSKSQYEDSNDSSRLSLPDFDSPRKLASSDSDGLSDSPRKSEFPGRGGIYELDDTDDRTNERRSDNKTELDISMTPEMTDCLRLLNQAERKLEMPPSSVHSDRGTNLPPSLRSNPASLQVTSSRSASSKVPPVAYNSSFKPQSFSSSESMKSWEQEFFRGLHANPYKPYNKFSNPPSSHASITTDNNKDMHGKFVHNDPPSSLHDNFSLSKNFESSLPHTHNAGPNNTNPSSLSSHPANQNPLSSVFSSSHLQNSSSNPYGGGIGIGNGSNHNSNPLLSHYDKHQAFTSLNTISLSSSGNPYTMSSSGSNTNPLDRRPVGTVRAPTPPPPLPGPSSSNLFSLSKNPSSYTPSTSSKDLHSGLYSSSHSLNPSSSHSTFRNPLPPSLNNSSLEWPDSPVKDFKSSDLDDLQDVGSSNSNDFLPSTSSFRDRNRFALLAGSNSPRSLQSKNGQDYIFASANSSFSSDINNSSFLPEPKKRLFNLDDDLDFPTSKTAKK